MSRYCTSCGSQIADGTRFCSNCGTPVSQTGPEQEHPQEKSVGQDNVSQGTSSGGQSPVETTVPQPPPPEVGPTTLPPPPRPEQVVTETPPQPQGGRRSPARLALYGCAGLLGLGLLLALAGALLVGGGGPGPSPNPAQGPQPGVLSGKVVDSQGNPLGDVDVSVKELNGAFSQDTTTDDQGNYSMQVDDGNYSVDATINTEYNGQFYRLTLHPEDGDNTTEEPSSEGIVEDFVWKISGPRPGVDPNSDDGADHYGGSIQHIYLGDPAAGLYNTTQLPEGSAIEITLVPDGPLMDGSEGETISVECTISSNSVTGGDTGCWIYDIPLGQYAVTANAATPDGASVPLNVGVSNIADSTAEDTEMSSSTLLQFQPMEADTYVASEVVPANLYILPANGAAQSHSASPAPQSQ
jgi:hypothetical protein